jgi:hypothetical protein
MTPRTAVLVIVSNPVSDLWLIWVLICDYYCRVMSEILASDECRSGYVIVVDMMI